MSAVKFYDAPPISKKEILRYCGAGQASQDLTDLMHSCMDELQGLLHYRVCYREMELLLKNNACDFGSFSVQSEQLAKNLRSCRRAILFCATLGMEIDRLILKYSHIFVAKALMLQAIGAERIEALCNRFCKDLMVEYPGLLHARFSPGYGDLPLSVQKDVFCALDCTAKIGVYLNDSFSMSPSKSVTAFIGIAD